MTTATTKNSGFEWRTLLGPTHNWPVTAAEFTASQQGSSIECCELCGEPIAVGRPFTTNSAGERAMHLACLNEPEPIRREARPTGQSGSIYGKRWSGAEK